MILYSCKMQISTELFLLSSLLFLLFLPHIYLFLIFSIMGITEFIYGFNEKLKKLIICLYEIISYIVQTPILLAIIFCIFFTPLKI